MGTNFPSSDDVFTEPSAPASTPLGSAGDSARDMVDNHGDMGLAVMAMQAEATLLTHNHNGTTRNGSKLTQARTHQSPDTDTAVTALHHTIGTGANQGAAGNHTHGAPDVWPVHSIFITELAGDPNAIHGLPGTWTQIQGFFIVAAGSVFTAGTTGGSTSHDHDATFSTTGAHAHSSPSVDAAGSHGHTSTTSGSSTFGHTHGSTSSSSSTLSFRYRGGGGASSMSYASHSHSSLTAGSSGSGTDHTHGVGNTQPASSHGHTVASMNSQGDHTHTSTISSSGHIPPYLAVYVWERTA